MPRLRRHPSAPEAAGRGAISLWLILGLAACDTTTAAGPGAPFVLTTRGDPVQAHSPQDVEVTLGAKRVRPADEPAAVD